MNYSVRRFQNFEFENRRATYVTLSLTAATSQVRDKNTYLVIVAQVHAAVQHDVLAPQRHDDAAPPHICSLKCAALASLRK